MCVDWRRDSLRPLHQCSNLVRVDKVDCRFTFYSHTREMFVRASEPRAYLEEDQHRPDRGLDCLPLAQPRLLRPVFPRSQIGHTFLPVCPANHLFGHTHLSNSPLASAWGRLRRGKKGAFHLRPHRSPFGQPLVPRVQVSHFA